MVDVFRHILSGVLLAGVALVASGCRESVAQLDRRDRTVPLMQGAAASRDRGDIDGAVLLFLEALEGAEGPHRAHLDLALLYHDELKDHLRAVYHYERYLQCRPRTEKRAMVEERARLARQRLGALPTPKPTVTPPDHIAEVAWLKAEVEKLNRSLATEASARREAEAGLETETQSVAGRVRRVEKERDQSVADARKDSAAKVRAADSALAKAETARATAEAARAKAVAGAVSLRREIATGRADLERMEARAERAELAARSPAPVTAPSPVSPPSVRPPVSPAAPREYQVKKGDSLTKIAQLMYADATRWKEIYTANSDKMGTSGRLRVGQVLVIPEGR